MRKRSEAAGADKQSADPFDAVAGAADKKAAEDLLEKSSERQEKEPVPPPQGGKTFQFETAHGAKETALSCGMERLVERTFVDDPEKVYERLESSLKVGEKRSDRGTLLRELDEAESNARDAFKLWRTAQLVVKQWEHENQVVNSAMRSEATRALEAEKKNGLRTKQVTDADVEAMVAAMYPEEHKAQQARRLKVHSLERNCENLNELWSSRCRTLAVMAGHQR